jgi:hypothetical protein
VPAMPAKLNTFVFSPGTETAGVWQRRGGGT